MIRQATLIAFLWLAILASTVAAAQVRIATERLDGPGIALRDVTAALQSTPAAAAPALQMRVGSLTVPALGWQRVGADFSGTLARDAPGHWRVVGDLELRGAVGGALHKATLTLVVDTQGNSLQLRLDGTGQHRIDIALPLDDTTHLQLDLTRVPLAWLQGVLARVWPDGRLGAGQVDAGVALDVMDNGLRSSGRFALTGAGFDSRSGTVAGQSLNGSGTWSMRGGATSRVDLDTRLKGGELLLGPLYASLPDRTARLQLRADVGTKDTRLTNVHFDDGGTLRFDGSLRFAADGSVTDLQLDGLRARFPDAYDHYAKVWLATLGFGALNTDGMLTGSLALQHGELQRFTLDADGIDVVDPTGRIGVDKLRGGLDWVRDGTRDATTLAWDGLTLVHLPFGAARTSWRSVTGTLGLAAPANVPVLGGQLALQRLAWTPAHAKEAGRVDVALAASGIQLKPLSRLFGWPAFAGTLAGAVPALHYDGEHIVFDGGLAINVFDGFVDVTQLTLAQPFGATPELHADIALRQLDLQRLTEVFGFGSISGRLDGDIDKLHMLAWHPVAFDANLRADDGGRISQRAIDSLSHLGGGLGSGLQSTVLKVFKSFGYDRIGLGCTLRDDICHMRGVTAASDGGYVIVDGRGLPHIEIIGHQHDVDWPTLVERLAAATAGGGVRVE